MGRYGSKAYRAKCSTEANDKNEENIKSATSLKHSITAVKNKQSSHYLVLLWRKS